MPLPTFHHWGSLNKPVQTFEGRFSEMLWLALQTTQEQSDKNLRQTMSSMSLKW